MYWNHDRRHWKSIDRRLIETWDVLKYSKTDRLSNASKRLIETWDVLK